MSFTFTDLARAVLGVAAKVDEIDRTRHVEDLTERADHASGRIEELEERLAFMTNLAEDLADRVESLESDVRRLRAPTKRMGRRG